ncbi:C-C chemokine receptor type 10 [Fukomys damarensis]|uniref:C-C chemokine receptor type 10 n=1 Tax=Fukomys damarensis TaxID=885580 RepID=UPI001455A8EB|nr:C-C chemokine receptor type 10 [Fukomys damarensis]
MGTQPAEQVSWGSYSGDTEDPYSAETLPEICSKADVQAFSRAFQPSVLLTVAFLGLAGNSLVLATHLVARHAARSPTAVHLLQLALADLLLALTLPFAAGARAPACTPCRSGPGGSLCGSAAALQPGSAAGHGRPIGRPRTQLPGQQAGVMAACYALLGRTLLAARGPERRRALRVVVALVAAFVVLQLPYSLALLLDTADLLAAREHSCPASKRKDLALLVTGGLALARCGLNPVLYAFLGLRFRQDLQALLRGVGCGPRAHPRGRCPRRPRLSSCSAPTETHSVSWDS